MSHDVTDDDVMMSHWTSWTPPAEIAAVIVVVSIVS